MLTESVFPWNRLFIGHRYASRPGSRPDALMENMTKKQD